MARELPLLRLALTAAAEWRWGGGGGGRGGGGMDGGEGHGTDGGAPAALLLLMDERWARVLRELRSLSAEPQREGRAPPPNLHLPPNLHRRTAAPAPAPVRAPAPPTPAAPPPTPAAALPAMYQCALWSAALRRYATARLPALLAEPEERGASCHYPWPEP